MQFCYIFFSIWEIFSQTRVSFYATQSSYLLKTWKKVILTCFTKIIAEQSSVIQYVVTNVSYEERIERDLKLNLDSFFFIFFFYSHCIVSDLVHQYLYLGITMHHNYVQVRYEVLII